MTVIAISLLTAPAGVEINEHANCGSRVTHLRHLANWRRLGRLQRARLHDDPASTREERQYRGLVVERSGRAPLADEPTAERARPVDGRLPAPGAGPSWVAYTPAFCSAVVSADQRVHRALGERVLGLLQKLSYAQSGWPESEKQGLGSAAL